MLKFCTNRFWSQVTWNIEIEVAKKRIRKRGVSIWLLREDFEKILLELEWWYKVRRIKKSP